MSTRIYYHPDSLQSLRQAVESFTKPFVAAGGIFVLHSIFDPCTIALTHRKISLILAGVMKRYSHLAEEGVAGFRHNTTGTAGKDERGVYG